MKRVIVIALALSTLVTASAGEAVGKSYVFSLPDGVTYQSRGEMEFYTFRWGTAPQLALFMLNVNPVPLSTIATESMADTMERTFEEQMKAGGLATDIQKKKTKVILGSFKGTELEFVITHAGGIKVRQYIFVLHDGRRMWNGQLTAFSEADLKTAHTIIENAKSIANSATDSTGK